MTPDDFLKYVNQQVSRYRKEYTLSEGKGEGIVVPLLPVPVIQVASRAEYS